MSESPRTDRGSLPFSRYQSSPSAFFRDVLGWTPWSKQTDIANALRDALLSFSSPHLSGGEVVQGRSPRTGEALPSQQEESPLSSVPSVLSVVNSPPSRFIAVRSGNGVGKTAIAARLMLWVVACFPDSVVITTAPTTRQVDELTYSLGTLPPPQGSPSAHSANSEELE